MVTDWIGQNLWHIPQEILPVTSLSPKTGLSIHQALRKHQASRGPPVQTHTSRIITLQYHPCSFQNSISRQFLTRTLQTGIRPVHKGRTVWGNDGHQRSTNKKPSLLASKQSVRCGLKRVQGHLRLNESPVNVLLRPDGARFQGPGKHLGLGGHPELHSSDDKRSPEQRSKGPRLAQGGRARVGNRASSALAMRPGTPLPLPGAPPNHLPSHCRSSGRNTAAPQQPGIRRSPKVLSQHL